jgi:hypothetical protein
MTDIDLIDALALYLQHQPDCPKDPCTCGMMTLFAVLMHRLIPSRHPAPDTTGLQECVDALWEQHVPLAPRAVLE